jgi:pilus assembly protein CpaE
MFSSGLRKSDIEQVLGDSFAAAIPNHYGIVREAIDRGVPLEEIKPGNKITLALKKIILPQAESAGVEKGIGKFKLSWAR